MISFRYHLASLIAVLLALAAGIAVGSGPLQRTADDTLTSGNQTRGASAAAATREALAYSDSFVASAAPGMVANRLNGRTVSVVVLPGAPQPAVTSVSDLVRTAGGEVVSTLQVGPDLVSAAKKQLVDELGGQLEAAATKVQVPAGAGGYERLGLLLAHAVGTTQPGGDQIDEQGQGILAGLSTAGLVTPNEQLQRRANLLLVVAGPPDSDAESAQGEASIVVSLAKALDGATGGVVVSGPLSAANPDGVLAAVRADPSAAETVSTADSVDRPPGAVAAVLALAEQAAGSAGQYGGGRTATAPYPGATVQP